VAHRDAHGVADEVPVEGVAEPLRAGAGGSCFPAPWPEANASSSSPMLRLGAMGRPAAACGVSGAVSPNRPGFPASPNTAAEILPRCEARLGAPAATAAGSAAARTLPPSKRLAIAASRRPGFPAGPPPPGAREARVDVHHPLPLEAALAVRSCRPFPDVEKELSRGFAIRRRGLPGLRPDGRGRCLDLRIRPSRPNLQGGAQQNDRDRHHPEVLSPSDPPSQVRRAQSGRTEGPPRAGLGTVRPAMEKPYSLTPADAA
jgi:hypothetical protein